MIPTLSVQGDCVYIDKSFRRGRGVKVGDLIDFKHPLVLGQGAVKRVMGMPGDFVVKDMGEGGEARMIQVSALLGFFGVGVSEWLRFVFGV